MSKGLTNVLVAGLLLGGALVTSPAAADFDCQKTAACQRQAAAKQRADRPVKRASAATARRTFEPSRTAVKMRLAQTVAERGNREAPTAERTPVPACRTKPAVCFRLGKR